MGTGMKNGYLKSRNIRELVGIHGGSMVILWDEHEDFLSGDTLPKNKGDLREKKWPKGAASRFIGYIKVCDWIYCYFGNVKKWILKD